ncbi:MAG: Gfo/Idh/MocA family oxidoreductase [Reichenbachiella sp.]|uniref:Gfo/Idh/MocA family protein n=1 Tax=Reichenbachiella sp. TaxID=2184521 RepID=UPI003267E215
MMKRRDFVKLSGLTVSATALGGPNVLSNSLKGSNKVRIGVIGTGSRGLGMITEMSSIADLVVVACADIIPSRLSEAVQRTNGRSESYQDYRKLLDDQNVDAVFIATPFSMHAQMAIEALDAGKHVYCEKTMAKGAESIRKVVKAVHASSKVFQTGHQYHNSRLYQAIAQMVSDDKIGPLSSFQCQWNRNGDWRRPVEDPKWERMINWRMYREYSGGMMAELCSHQIDFINWITGSRPQTVMGMGGIDYWKDGRETYDNIHVMMEYKNGLKGKFTCLTTNGFDDYKIKLFGKKGTIVVDYANAWLYSEADTEKKEFDDIDGVSGATVKRSGHRNYVKINVPHKDPSRQALIDFRDSIRDGQKVISDVKTGALAAYGVFMANRAMQKQTIETWDDNFYQI